MEKLVEFLTERIKIGYSILVIMGFLLPGSMFVFIWNRDVYIALDIFQLILLSISIPFLLFIPNFLVCLCFLKEINDDGTVKNDYVSSWVWGTLFTDFELILGMLLKIYINKLTIKAFITGVIALYVGGFLIIIIRDLIVRIINFVLERKR